MIITLTYKTRDGEEKQVEFEKDVGYLSLSEHGIRSIDLSPLSSCTELRTFNLGRNSLETVNLEPLGSCIRLKELRLSSNRLKKMDLNPIRSCVNLEKLYLDSNRYLEKKEIDFSPLESCKKLKTLELEHNLLERINLSYLGTNLSFLDLNGNCLRSIDLSDLRSRSALNWLGIRGNGIQSINLTPLKLRKNLQTLKLGYNPLKTIDLTPLRSCTDLRYLELDIMQLQSIDLAPLESCPNLQRLRLGENQLESIDLTPLKSCPHLAELSLKENRLKSIDLAPISSCVEHYAFYLDLSGNCFQSIDLSTLQSLWTLRELNLSKNNLHDVNMSPLFKCASFQKLDLRENELQSIDITALLKLEDVKLIGQQKLTSWLRPTREFGNPLIYSRPTHLYPWPFLYEVAIQFPNDLRIQHDILAALGLADYGFIDRDLTDLLLSISPATSTDDAQAIISQVLLNEIIASVDRGGHTTGLHIENLAGKHAEIALRAKEILELRKNEIARLVVEVNRDPNMGLFAADLRELCVTAYGFEVVAAMNLKHIRTSMAELAFAQRALEEIGFQIRTGDDACPGVNMSDDLKECIFWILVNTGVPLSNTEKATADS